jgi:hypothetical protein
MVKTVTFNTEIPANRELRITLPGDVPTGSAAIVVTVSSPGPPKRLDFRQPARIRVFRDVARPRRH